MKKKILFVCLGNICRSPAAQAIMQKYVDDAGLQNNFYIDSAGLYAGHAGELPDPRMRQHARRRGYQLLHHSRPVNTSDFNEFDLIVAMDDSNFHGLRRLAPTIEDQNKIIRMIDYVKGYPQYHSVPDPYYEGAEGFEIVLDLLEDGCRNLLDSLISQQTESN
ncbi:MAG: low molecular weight phosphotyrosine protein phosphatase [Muribaculaceae bacterium]|nr:low molecular weight phosphotyrosine protein phosphatase [Muribaculaceae bacterium]